MVLTFSMLRGSEVHILVDTANLLRTPEIPVAYAVCLEGMLLF